MAVRNSDNQFERRLQSLQTIADWQNLLEHFELNDHSFAYIPVLLPNDLWARVCEAALEQYLSAQGKNLHKVECQTPDELKNIAATLFALEIDGDTEALWIVSPVGSGETFLREWEGAWREGTARLNQYRNPLRDKFPVTMLFVGADWTQEITRTMAPDLWSIRRTVIRIKPEVGVFEQTGDTGEFKLSDPVFTQGQGVDAEFTLHEAERLRGKKGAELTLAEVLYRAAVGFSAQGQHQKAIETVDEAIAIYENQMAHAENDYVRDDIKLSLADALFAKGYALDELRDFDREAENYYRRVIELDPLYSAAYYNLGTMLLRDENRWDESERLLRRAFELNPSYADAYYNLGWLLYKIEGRQAEAEEYYRKAIEINPNYTSAYYNLGLLLERDESRWHEAEEMYRKTIELDPNRADAYSGLGWILAKDVNRRQEAERMYRRAIEIDPNYPDAYTNLGLFLFNEGNRQKEAEEIYRKAIELNPNDALAYNNLGVLLDKDEKRKAEAEQMYRRAIELNPVQGDYFFNLAWLLAKDKKRLSEAEEFYRKAVEINPQDAEGFFNLGILLENDEKNLKKAEEMYRRATEINPNYADAFNNLGVVQYKDSKRAAEAFENFKKAAELNPNLANVHNNLGVLLFKYKNKPQEAEKEYLKAIELAPNYAMPHYNLACLLALSGKPENKAKALDHLEKSIRLDAQNKESAQTDTDLDSLRNDERFKKLIGS